MLKKIVLVCHHFIPYTPAVGGVARVWYLADYLSRQGFEVLVVTSDGHNFGNLGFPALPEKVKVAYVSDPIKKLMQRQVFALGTGGGGGSTRGRIVLGLKRLLKILAFPDFAVFALPAYWRKLKKLLNNEDVAAVLISAPSHSLLLLAIFFAKHRKKGVRFLADYRDGWNARGAFAARGLLSGYISRRLERAVCEEVDYALFATKVMRANTEAMFPVLAWREKALTVMNGYPESVVREISGCVNGALPGNFKMGHFGVVNDQAGSYRNIEPVLQALSVLRRRGFDFTLMLFGDVRFARINISDYDFVVLGGSVPHSDALACMKSMDCLLMYHIEKEGAREVVMGKVFDYISACRPILCVSPLDMEGAVIVDEGRFGRVASFEDYQQIYDAFSAIYNGEFAVDVDSASGFSREAQYSKILPLVSS